MEPRPRRHQLSGLSSVALDPRRCSRRSASIRRRVSTCPTAIRLNGSRVPKSPPTSRKSSASSRCWAACSQRRKTNRKAPRVTVIGEGLWRERFGASPDVLGRVLKLNGVPHTIVGVMPRAAEFPGEVRLWVPVAGDPLQQGQSYGCRRPWPPQARRLGGAMRRVTCSERRSRSGTRATRIASCRRSRDRCASSSCAISPRHAKTLLTAVAPAARRDLRERRQHHARERAGAAAGNGHPPRGRRQPPSPRPSATRRKPRAGCARRSRGARAGPMGAAPARDDRRRSDPARGPTSPSTAALSRSRSV